MSIAPLTVYHIHSLTLSPSPAIRLESLHIVGQILKIKILDAQNQNALFSIIFPCSGSYMRVIIDELVFLLLLNTTWYKRCGGDVVSAVSAFI